MKKLLISILISFWFFSSLIFTVDWKSENIETKIFSILDKKLWQDKYGSNINKKVQFIDKVIWKIGKLLEGTKLSLKNKEVVKSVRNTLISYKRIKFPKQMISTLSWDIDIKNLNSFVIDSNKLHDTIINYITKNTWEIWFDGITIVAYQILWNSNKWNYMEYYLWAVKEWFYSKNWKVKEEILFDDAILLNFQVLNKKYTIVSHMMPQKWNYYIEEVKKLFPSNIFTKIALKTSDSHKNMIKNIDTILQIQRWQILSWQ